LLQLDDALSWRAGLRSIATDGKASLTDRLHASKVLLEAEDAEVSGFLRALVEGLAGRPEEEQRQVVDFLVTVNNPLTPDLLFAIAADNRLSDATRRSARVPSGARVGAEEPRVRIIDEQPRSAPEPIGRAVVKKKETREATFLTMPTILAGGVTLVLFALLLVEILPKG